MENLYTFRIVKGLNVYFNPLNFDNLKEIIPKFEVRLKDVPGSPEFLKFLFTTCTVRSYYFQCYYPSPIIGIDWDIAVVDPNDHMLYSAYDICEKFDQLISDLKKTQNIKINSVDRYLLKTLTEIKDIDIEINKLIEVKDKLIKIL